MTNEPDYKIAFDYLWATGIYELADHDIRDRRLRPLIDLYFNLFGVSVPFMVLKLPKGVSVADQIFTLPYFNTVNHALRAYSDADSDVDFFLIVVPLTGASEEN